MKMRNSNNLIYFPGDELMEEKKEEEKVRAQTFKESGKKKSEIEIVKGGTIVERKRGFFEKLFGLNKPVKEKVTHSVVQPLDDIPKAVLDSMLISASWDIP